MNPSKIVLLLYIVGSVLIAFGFIDQNRMEFILGLSCHAFAAGFLLSRSS